MSAVERHSWKIVMRWVCCRRCGGVGTKLATIIGGQWFGGDDGLPCGDCKGEGVRYVGKFEVRS